MTDTVDILRCAYCGKRFSYVPTAEDMCPPGTKNQICDECAEALLKEEPYDPTTDA